jgi:hypothetical protein
MLFSWSLWKISFIIRWQLGWRALNKQLRLVQLLKALEVGRLMSEK